MVDDILLQEIRKNLNDLRIRDPQAYRRLERELAILQIKTGNAVAQSPVGVRTMERMK